MISSVGMVTFPTEWKNKSHVPNHQSLINLIMGPTGQPRWKIFEIPVWWPVFWSIDIDYQYGDQFFESSTTVDLCETLHHLVWLKPYNYWYKPLINWRFGFRNHPHAVKQLPAKKPMFLGEITIFLWFSMLSNQDQSHGGPTNGFKKS